jgi:hypothetical protein
MDREEPELPAFVRRILEAPRRRTVAAVVILIVGLGAVLLDALDGVTVVDPSVTTETIP